MPHTNGKIDIWNVTIKEVQFSVCQRINSIGDKLYKVLDVNNILTVTILAEQLFLKLLIKMPNHFINTHGHVEIYFGI